MSWYEPDFYKPESNNAEFDPNSVTNRYWMPKGTDGEFIVLSDEKFVILEHNWWTQSRGYRNWATCLRMLKEPCDLCVMKVKKGQRGIISILDCREWEDKRGGTHKNERKFFAGGQTTWELLGKKLAQVKESEGSWVGAVISVHRTKGEKSPGCGDSFDLLRMIDVKEFAEKNEVDMSPLDSEVFKPNPDFVKIVAGEMRKSEKLKEAALDDGDNDTSVDYE